MEAFDSNDHHHNAKKSRFHQLTEIKKLFRIIEIFLLLVSLTWASTRLPLAVKLSGECLRQLLNVVVGHLFIFLLTNFILLTLFFTSRHLFSQQDCFHSVISETQMDFGQELIGNSKSEEDIVFQDKQMILEVKKVKVHRRSQSENLGRKKSLEEDDGGSVKQLRRSETERQRIKAAEVEVEVVEELSNEEFQRAIEAFIAKQIKFHQEEKLAIVVPHACT